MSYDYRKDWDYRNEYHEDKDIEKIKPDFFLKTEDILSLVLSGEAPKYSIRWGLPYHRKVLTDWDSVRAGKEAKIDKYFYSNFAGGFFMFIITRISHFNPPSNIKRVNAERVTKLLPPN